MKKNAFIESVQQPLVKVCDQFNRLQLKEEKMQGLATTATAEQLEELFVYAKQVDSTLAQTDFTKVKLSKKKTNLKSFTSKHCQIRHYSFQIKKCMDETYTYCLEKQMPIEVFSSLPWIPDPVPKDDVSEKYLPYLELRLPINIDHPLELETIRLILTARICLFPLGYFLFLYLYSFHVFFVSLQLTVSM